MRMKPSRSQSMVGMVVGIIFCFIGLFMAIPNLGFFGVIWTGVAVIITIMHAINFFSDEGIATHEIIVEEIEKEKIVSQPKKESVEGRLSMVDQLYEQGTITKEEREEKRKKILDEI